MIKPSGSAVARAGNHASTACPEADMTQFTSSPESSGVSVIIPAYNYQRYLAETVQSALAQDYPGPLEVVVVDDGSTDGTGEVAGQFGGRIRYHRKVNGGLSAARNTGMEIAAYDWVLFLDADDLLEPHAVRSLVDARDTTLPCPAVIGSLGRMIDAEGAFTSPGIARDGSVETFAARDFVLRNRFPPIALADRRVLLAAGGFDPALRASEDRDMWIRAATAGPVCRLNATLHRKRDHGSNMSRQAQRQTESILQVLEKAAANPQANLHSGTLRTARAVCLFQSARMHLAAGSARAAVRQCLRSLGARLWVPDPRSVGLPAFFRLRFLTLRLLGACRAAKDGAS
ncbi:MAG: glycosyltransferase family 2 protein [Verrucomicrobiales bacterium]|nr:glycosyltransferase family 2 protein [Verrucomicrobiales bacterium]